MMVRTKLFVKKRRVAMNRRPVAQTLPGSRCLFRVSSSYARISATQQFTLLVRSQPDGLRF